MSQGREETRQALEERQMRYRRLVRNLRLHFCWTCRGQGFIRGPHHLEPCPNPKCKGGRQEHAPRAAPPRATEGER